MIALNGGRPELLNLKDILRAFVDFREEVVTRRTKFLLAKARDSAHVQVGLAIAVANIDEVIRLIRTSPDAAAAREALMARDWPARDMAPLIALIADPRHALRRGRHLPAVRGPGARHPRIAPAAPHRARPRRDRRGTEQARRRDRRLSRHPALARPHLRHHQGRDRRPCGPHFATPRRTEILDSDADMEDEDLIQREDMVVTVSATPATSSACRSRPTGRSGAAARAAPACRRGTRISSPACSSPRRTRRSCSSRRAGRSTRRRSGACRWPRRRRAARRWSTCCRSSEGERITTIMPLPEDEAAGTSSTSCSPRRAARCGATSCPTSPR